MKTIHTTITMQIQEKKQRKNTTNKITIKVPMQGKKIPVQVTVGQLASLIKKLNPENTAVNIEELPAPEQIMAYIEGQDRFRHSMPGTMQHFLGESRKEFYHSIYRMLKNAREQIEKKHNNGKFKEEKIPVTSGKGAGWTITVWYFEYNKSDINQ